MTTSTKKALPWLVSLGTHLAALAVIALLLSLAPRPLRGSRVEVSLVGGTGFGGGSATARPGTPAASRGPALPGRPGGKSNRGSGSAQRGAADEAAPPDVYSLQASRASAASTPAAAVSASDILSDAESAGAASSLPAVGSDASQAGPEPGGSPGLFAGGTEWGWQGLPRKLLRRRNPEFPTLLSALGQEVEAEARITVAPSGIVTRVEITRSTGYIEIDASVEAALRDYLFSRVDGRVDSSGTVKFRFRLERQD